jgi:hypothetical protein
MNTQSVDVNLTLGSDYWPSDVHFTRVNSDDLMDIPEEGVLIAPPEVEPTPLQHPTAATTPVAEVSVADAADTPPRPLRAAKRRAIERIRGIQYWERCSESSELFRRVERRFNEELNNEILSREEREELERHPETSDVPEQGYNDEMEPEDSEDESPTASLRDFIVTDDEDVPDDESFHTCSEIDSEADTEEETASEHADEASESETQEY